ncbi:putative amidoligase enzyme-domain-containing protein [Xylariaceae sp. AK1471]|nr:putative amidoligase enzyme-domain-containing protein [Xylariaceae sp. AK1471]
MMTSNYLSFNFGIEIELLLSSRSKNHKSWKSLASELSIRLAGAGIPNHLNESNDSSPENYTEWSITQEVTIPPQMGKKNLWGIELVSPVFTTTQTDSYQTHISHLFHILKFHFTITPSTHCSTHIHISTSPPLQPSHLLSIAKTILYYEPALDSLFPVDRSNSYWCQSNRSNPALKNLTLPQCFEYLDACVYQQQQQQQQAQTHQQQYDQYQYQHQYQNHYQQQNPTMMTTTTTPATTATQEIVRAMNLFPARSAYGRAHNLAHDFVHGVYKWDFSGLLPPDFPSHAKGTLEFRQSPGSRAPEDVLAYVELAVSFVAGALQRDLATTATGLDPDGGKRRVNALREDLWWLLCAGAQSSGIGHLAGVEKLFVQVRKTGNGNGNGNGKKGRN